MIENTPGWWFQRTFAKSIILATEKLFVNLGFNQDMVKKGLEMSVDLLMCSNEKRGATAGVRCSKSIKKQSGVLMF